jgi:methylthioribose-1-phosphate isomerase
VGYLLQQGQVDAILVGADRIAANGDVANKIGTYSLAVLGRVHHVPFYVAAPSTTIDLNSPDGTTIPIEMRDGAEIASFNRTPTASESVAVYNPGFDITPSTYVDAIITEVGIARHPYNASLREMVSSHD